MSVTKIDEWTMEWMTTLIGFLGGGFGGALVGYALDRRSAIANQVRAQKRDLYASLVRSLRIFQWGGAADEEEKDAFLTDYAQVWLWASDEVIMALNTFIDHNQRLAAGERTIQAELDRSFDELMLQMRKDLRSTALPPGTYRSISFQ
jgi:hypothetical protein